MMGQALISDILDRSVASLSTGRLAQYTVFYFHTMIHFYDTFRDIWILSWLSDKVA